MRIRYLKETVDQAQRYGLKGAVLQKFRAHP